MGALAGVPTEAMTIAENVQRVRAQVADAAARAGRKPDEVTLVAVTKTFPVDVVLAGYAAGLRDFGENRVQEGEEKIAAASAQTREARWHLIGHLQSNKVKAAVGSFDVIHSVDSLKLAQTISRRYHELRGHARRMPVLIEVNVGDEDSKSGYRLSDAETFWREAELIAALPGVQLQGLMTIAPWARDAEDARPCFARLRELRDLLGQRLGHPLPHLSMGMSADFGVAIEEGATLVRIGTALFGERTNRD
jgi:PLP dependent protein